MNLYDLLGLVQSKATTGTPSGYVLFKPVKVTTGTGKKKKTKTVLIKASGSDSGTFATLHRDPSTGNAGLLDSHGGKVPTGWKVLKVPPKTVVISCNDGRRRSARATPRRPAGRQLRLLSLQARGVPERPVRDRRQVPEHDGQGSEAVGRPSGLRPERPADRAPRVHRSRQQGLQAGHAERGDPRADRGVQGNQCGNTCAFAIVLDNEIRSFPTINFHRTRAASIRRGTGAEINNIGSTSEAKQLAVVLQTGALPVQFKTLERTDVSATLGKDSLKEAQRAAIGGLIAVALFLLFLYRFLGLVAVIGLGIYAAFMYAAILLFGVTLTLPGFAGLILTIGVAADANVVIFERIKEEARAGKSVRAAIAAGYAKGFRTIVDANVVTAITALILFAVATASVKGFALMLLIGTAVSLITAVAATRAMLGLLAGFRWFENPSFMGAHHSQRGAFLQIDFMKRIALWFSISGAVILISFLSLGVRGLNLGIDFKGGVQITFKTPKATPLETVRTQTRAIGRGTRSSRAAAR